MLITVVMTTIHPATTVINPAFMLSKNPIDKVPSAIAKPTAKDTIIPVNHATKFNKCKTFFAIFTSFVQ